MRLPKRPTRLYGAMSGNRDVIPGVIEASHSAERL
jgi:hypothetical protein